MRLSIKTYPEAFVVCLPVRWFLGTKVPFHTCNDLSEQLLGSVTKERHAAHQELIKDDPHGPPVDWLSITLAKNHLRSNVLRGAANLSNLRTQRNKPRERGSHDELHPGNLRIT